MKRFVPKGRPHSLKDPRTIPIHLESSMIEQIDKYLLDHGVSSRADLFRQLFQHTQEQEQEDKDQLTQQDQDKSVSCISHKLGEITSDATEEPSSDNVIINKTPLELCMESVSTCLIGADKALNDVKDLQLRKRLKAPIDGMLREIRRQNQLEYNRKNGLDRNKSLHDRLNNDSFTVANATEATT